MHLPSEKQEEAINPCLFLLFYTLELLMGKRHYQEKSKPRQFVELAGLDEKKSRRRPTLAGPIVRLPLARQRFTSGFGTGPGGTTALWPPGFRGKRVFSSSCLPGSPWGL